jgi:subtilisin family serine protease
MIAAFCCLPLTGSNTFAQPYNPSSDNVSPFLRQSLQRVKSGEDIKVIIQLNASPSSRLNALLQRKGIRVKGRFANFQAMALEIPSTTLDELARFPEISYISRDEEIGSSGHVTQTTGTDDIRTETTTATTINSLGLPVITSSTKIFDGSGVGIAIIDSGIDPTHKNLLGRITFNRDFTGENRTDDPFGHGSHVGGMAAGKNNIYGGIANGASILNLRVLNSKGTGSASALLASLNWVLANRAAYNIRIVNLSLGAPAIESYKNDPLCKAARQLVDAGIIVVAAAGNNGKNSAGQKIYGQIHSPGNEPSVLTVGASNTFGTDSRADDNIASFSSRGPTRSYWTDVNNVNHYDNLVKPDLVAPGNKIINTMSDVSATFSNQLVIDNPLLDAKVASFENKRMMFLSGTSMAAPAAAGTVALLLQANPKLTPNMVKVLLTYTAQPISGFNTFEQGAGQLNVKGAMQLAKLVRQDLTANTP